MHGTRIRTSVAVIDEHRKSRAAPIAHALWGLIAFSLCVLLASVPGGHPPAVIFIPPVVAVWVLGHAAIWGAGRIAARGRRIAAAGGHGARTWPVALVAVVVLTGIASALGVVQLVVSVFTRELYPFRSPGLWAFTMGIWLVHGACFVGLLLRKRWSRHLCTALPLAWAALPAVQIVDHLARGRPVDAIEMTIAAAVVLLLAAFARHLITSKRIESFLTD